MTRTPIIATVTAVAIAVCIAPVGPQSVAEPVPGGDTSVSSKVPAPSRELTDAEALFNKNDYAGALRLVQEAVKKDTELPPAHVIMAKWFAQVQRSDAGAGGIGAGSGRGAGNPRRISSLAKSRCRNAAIPRPSCCTRRPTACGPVGKEKPTERCAAAADPKWAGGDVPGPRRLDRRSKRLEAWLKVDPKSSPALRRLAQCLFQQKNVEGALEKLKEAAKIEPDVLTPEAVISRWFARTGDQENAKKWIVAALDAAPNDAKTRLVAAQWSFETGQLDEAKQQVETALRLDPKYFEAKFLRGLVALFQKELQDGRGLFRVGPPAIAKGLFRRRRSRPGAGGTNEESKKAYALDLANTNAGSSIRKWPRPSQLTAGCSTSGAGSMRPRRCCGA